MLSNAKVPVIGFAAWSGAGKTTLIKQVLPLLTAKGLRIGMVKHAHHNVDVDKPGKDSYELRKAGAGQMLLASHERWALMVEKPEASEPNLNEMIKQLNQDILDLILVEGFRDVPFAKIEVYRPALGKALRFPNDPDIIAVATDADLSEYTDLPLLNMNEPKSVSEFIEVFITND